MSTVSNFQIGDCSGETIFAHQPFDKMPNPAVPIFSTQLVGMKSGEAGSVKGIDGLEDNKKAEVGERQGFDAPLSLHQDGVGMKPSAPALKQEDGGLIKPKHGLIL